MTKTVTHIPVPPDWKSTNDWDSHKPVLYLSLQKQSGEVVEVGMGFGSTPFIGKECFIQGRQFFAFESNLEWFKKVREFYGTSHYFECRSYFDPKWLPKFASVADILFIDCAPGEIRKDLAILYKDQAKVIIIHDSELGSEYVYGLSPVLSTFKYRLDYQPEGKPHTTVVSDFVDVTKWIDAN